MESLRCSVDGFVISYDEQAELENVANKAVAVIKENNLTYIQAIEVLEQCKVKIQMSLIK